MITEWFLGEIGTGRLEWNHLSVPPDQLVATCTTKYAAWGECGSTSRSSMNGTNENVAGEAAARLWVKSKFLTENVKIGRSIAIQGFSKCSAAGLSYAVKNGFKERYTNIICKIFKVLKCMKSWRSHCALKWSLSVFYHYIHLLIPLYPHYGDDFQFLWL